VGFILIKIGSRQFCVGKNKKLRIDLNLHGASQKEKTFFRQDNRIDRIF